MKINKFVERVLIKYFESSHISPSQYLWKKKLVKRKNWVCDIHDLERIIEIAINEYEVLKDKEVKK